MDTQHNRITLISRERDRLWVDMEIKQGETNSELISRIRYEATTCDLRLVISLQ